MYGGPTDTTSTRKWRFRRIRYDEIIWSINIVVYVQNSTDIDDKIGKSK